MDIRLDDARGGLRETAFGSYQAEVPSHNDLEDVPGAILKPEGLEAFLRVKRVLRGGMSVVYIALLLFRYV